MRHQLTALQAGLVATLAFVYAETTPSGAACFPQPNEMVGWWRAEGGANDSAETNNGALLGGVTFGPGKVGEAFQFSGSNQYVEVPDSPALNPSSITIETWVYPTAVSPSTAMIVIGKDGASANREYLLALVLVGNQLVARPHVGVPGGYMNFNGTNVIPLNAWTHLAMTYDGSNLSLFVNGLLDGKMPVTGSINFTPEPLRIGGLPTGPWFFIGMIDEPTVYARALSASDIQAIYAAGAAGKCIDSPPTLITQPADQTAFEGANVTFNCLAYGTPPFSYQWTFDGTNLSNQTNASLAIINAETNQAGQYAVILTNSFGSVTSAVASLTVLPASCAPTPNALVAWWRGEGDANDAQGNNNGTLLNGATFGPAKAGQGFEFDGVNQFIEVPNSPGLNPSNITIETWVFPTIQPSSTVMIVVGKDGASANRQYLLALKIIGNQLIARPHVGVLGGYMYFDGTTPVPLNTWTHLAMTYDGSTLRLYVNGLMDGSMPVTGPIVPTPEPLRIGGLPSGPWYFTGLIDEASLYSQALSPAAIQSIYQAGSRGKCITITPPGFSVQPTGVAVTEGQTATFSAGIIGTSPLYYRWLFNGASLPGATNSTLTLTNVQMSQAGNYSVVVTNLYGSVVSSNAALVVNFAPATVQVGNASEAAGALVTVPILLVANGNENAIGFSVNYSPTLLTNVGVALGTGVTNGTLQFNTNQAGAVGVAVALSSGATFAPGTQEVAEISFVAAPSASGYSVPLTFGDQPTKRELSDPNAGLLAANFSNGQLTLSRSAFEADVSPRPNGDGQVTIVDWVQVGRYVAALDSPTNASEFQRADCAPRATSGDGLLTVSDWVQAGRYVAGLDPLTVAAGPTAPPGPGIALPLRKEGGSTQRVVSVQAPPILPGQTTGTALVELDAQGDENAIGLSLAFDPKVVSYTSASLGSDATSASMDVNANQATNGEVGIIMALPTGASFSPGTRQVLKVNFQALTTNTVNSTVALGDLPVRREVADTNAVPVVANYVNGTIAINPRPSISITHASQAINLSWPFWATNYALQQASAGPLSTATWTNLSTAPVLTNNALNITVPVSGSAQFYRLQHQ